MHLIIGLGNPGKEYERTRHNMGFIVVEALANDENLTMNKAANALILKTTLNEKRVLLAEPQTFMNESGVAVRALMDFYKLAPEDIIVVHDDKDVLLGEIKVQKDRGAAGHNGVASIIEHLGTKNFTRIRVGVAPQDKTIHDTAEFVLGKFTKEEQKTLSEVIVRVVEELRSLVAMK